MSQSMVFSTLRILRPNGKTVGTGFLVAPNLAATCAHVVEADNAFHGDTLQVQFNGRDEKISAIAISPNRRWLATGSVVVGRVDTGDRTVRLWHLNVEELLPIACKLIGRNFTRSEWEQYFPGESYSCHLSTVAARAGANRHPNSINNPGKALSGYSLLAPRKCLGVVALFSGIKDFGSAASDLLALE